MPAAFNTFNVLQPLMKNTYASKDKKKKNFKGPPDMPKSAMPVVKKADK